MTRFIGEYVPNWREISEAVKALAGYRCVRCQHPFTPHGQPEPCDQSCDAKRGRTRRGAGSLGRSAHRWEEPGLNYGIHHLDGDKANNRWWNLLALCNSCHLTIQASVIPEQGYQWEHSHWFKPYAAGFYAFRYAQVETTRDEVEADVDRFLAMGQPHLFAGALS